MKSLEIFSGILLVILLFSPAAAQGAPGATAGPDPRQLFAELVKPYRNLNDYTVTIHAKVNLPTMRVPDFTATLYFKKPDLFHIETRSFAPIPRNSGLFNPLQFDPEKNRITYQRAENLDGARAELYRVEPLDAKARIRYYNVWVGGLPRRILQAESLSFQGTKGLVKLFYATVARGGEKWLMPEKVHIHLTFPEEVTGPNTSSFITKDNPVSGGMGRLDEISGEGDIDIAYSDWRINTGLGENLFIKK
jgi:hypothetical protein